MIDQEPTDEVLQDMIFQELDHQDKNIIQFHITNITLISSRSWVETTNEDDVESEEHTEITLAVTYLNAEPIQID